MATFHEVRLPVDLELGAVGGPQFKTTVLELYSGYEQRNVNWSRTRGQWDVGYGVRDRDDMDSLIEFFYARQGKAYGFRFKDWTDFEIATAQTIGTGDGSTTDFQIYKRYSSGGYYYDRDIYKLVSGTTKVYKDGVQQTVNFSVDDNTGIVSFAIAPSAGEDITVVCEFDVPVRFDIDHLPVTAHGLDLESIRGIDIVEIRV